MNLSKKINVRTGSSYVYLSRKIAKTNSAEVISLDSQRNRENKEVTLSIDDLNEKLAYFYNHGGPIMDL